MLSYENIVDFFGRYSFIIQTSQMYHRAFRKKSEEERGTTGYPLISTGEISKFGPGFWALSESTKCSLFHLVNKLYNGWASKPLYWLLKVVCRHPELDDWPLTLRLHELHEVEKRNVVEQDVCDQNLHRGAIVCPLIYKMKIPHHSSVLFNNLSGRYCLVLANRFLRLPCPRWEHRLGAWRGTRSPGSRGSTPFPTAPRHSPDKRVE